MSVFTRGTASRSRAVPSSGGVAIVGASALVLAGCAGGGGGRGHARGDRSPDRGRHPQARHGPSADGQPRLPRPARRGRCGIRRRLRSTRRPPTPGLTVEVVYGDSGNTDNKAYETEIPRVLSEGVVGHHRRRIVEHVAAVHRPGDRRRCHPVLAGQHVRRLHDLRRQRPLLPHGAFRRAAGRGARQPDRRGRPPDARHDRAERLVRHRSGRLRHRRPSRPPAARSSQQPTYNIGDTTFDSQIGEVLAADPDAIVLITFDEVKTIVPALSAASSPATNLYFVDGNLRELRRAVPGRLPRGREGHAPRSVDRLDHGLHG